MRSTRHAPNGKPGKTANIGKHAKSSPHSTRNTLSAAATAALLPLVFASPALAQSSTPEASPSAPATTAPATSAPEQPSGIAETTMRISGPVGPVLAGEHLIGARLLADGVFVKDAEVRVERLGSAGWEPVGTMVTDGLGLAKQPFALTASTTLRVVFDGSATQQAGQTPEHGVTIAARKSDMTMRISGPAGTVEPGEHLIGVRLMADGVFVKDAYVRVERWGAGGWEYAGRMVTDGLGLAKQPFSFGADTRVRALYEGSATRTTAVTPEQVVTIATFRQRAVQVASEQQGKPYQWGSVGPNSFDCSGLVQYVFNQVGKSLPRSSGDMLGATQRLDQAAKKPGDLIFISNNGRVTHVGVYAGNDHFWVAPKPGDVVKLQKIYTSAYDVGRVA